MKFVVLTLAIISAQAVTLSKLDQELSTQTGRGLAYESHLSNSYEPAADTDSDEEQFDHKELGNHVEKVLNKQIEKFEKKRDDREN